jgi:hypothetical protein
MRQVFIPWFSPPQRLAYVHVVKEATKAKDHKGQLLTPITLGNRWRLSTRFTKGNTNTLELPQIALESFQEPLSV